MIEKIPLVDLVDLKLFNFLIFDLKLTHEKIHGSIKDDIEVAMIS